MPQLGFSYSPGIPRFLVVSLFEKIESYTTESGQILRSVTNPGSALSLRYLQLQSLKPTLTTFPPVKLLPHSTFVGNLGALGLPRTRKGERYLKSHETGVIPRGGVQRLRSIAVARHRG